ncbi:hypothetical protein DVH05_022392 [Phytophthora capsici]|nr:hypothetical protein DVH05_022392 [Phytophthora capsici]|eukprot:jgi/Phyca11/504608/fgenesh2_kg.PHYCAscaffold_8_\
MRADSSTEETEATKATRKKTQETSGGFRSRSRSRVIETVEPLLTSWFEIDNLAQATPTSSWRTGSRSVAHRYHEIDEVLQVQGIEDEESVNSAIKIQLHSTKEQKKKLDQMFAAQRAIYNKMVARSCEDLASRLTSRDKKTK